MKDPIKIILADDHAVVLDGIRSFLEKDKELQVVGAVANGEEVLQLIESGVAADVILADIDMPVMGGTELIRRLRQMGYPSKVIMLTMHDNEKYILQAFEAGADGYVYKQAEMEEIVFALKRIRRESPYICQALARASISKMLRANKLSNSVSLEDFSQRELEILALIADGYTNQEIAERLFTSRRTVEGHRLSLMGKTGVRNTAALVKYAMQHNMIR